MKNKKFKFVFFIILISLFILGLFTLSFWEMISENPTVYDIIYGIVWLIILDFVGALIYAIIKKTIKKDKEENSFLYYFVIGTAWILEGL